METSSTTIYDWNKKSERQRIYSIFRSIIRAAILTIPTTSPAKPEYLGEHFQRVNHPKLDFGARSLWQNLFTIEGDDPEAEIIEIPSAIKVAKKD